MPKTAITETAIRDNLLKRAEAFCKARRYSLSRIGAEALKDDTFLLRVQNGGNFTLRTYQRVIDWLDAQEAKAA
jgi:hypothetical protein